MTRASAHEGTPIELSHMIDAVRERSGSYTGGTAEQNLTYACEDVVVGVWPGPMFDHHLVVSRVESIAMDEGWDAPSVFFGRTPARCVAFTQLETRSVKFFEGDVHVVTMLHELAHLGVSAHLHGDAFRSELCRLVRSHWGVEQASLLHALYCAVNLPVGPWQATERRA